MLSVIGFIALASRWFLVGVPFGGYGTLTTIALFSFGLLTFMLGIIAEYLGLIYEEVKKRPNYVVDRWLS
ncbi:unannotated protein [freshwater metagenome]|uniref:Unannotated protein n=1 Tax=freshwater metagenome TaxID=449393 RepID=A0A6J6Q7J0_9ZZZZ